MYTKKIVSILVISLATAFASDEKIDSLLKVQSETNQQIKEINTKTNKLYEEQKNNPLENKTFGVEINPLWLLYLSEGLQLTGGVSLFSVHRAAEIAIPLVYRRNNDEDLTRFYISPQYRYFLGNTQNGFYLSGVGEYSYLEYGKLDFADSTLNGKDQTGNVNRLGLGVGVGYRKFSYKGLYWGCGITIGRYLWKDKEFKGISPEGLFAAVTDDFLFDVEFFKFGWAF